MCLQSYRSAGKLFHTRGVTDIVVCTWYTKHYVFNQVLFICCI